MGRRLTFRKPFSIFLPLLGMILAFLWPLAPGASAMDENCVSKQCFDGSVHDCNFDCKAYWERLHGGGGGNQNPAPAPADPAAPENADQQRIQDARAYNQDGIKYYEQGEYAMAISWFMAAVEKDPSNDDYRMNLKHAQDRLRAKDLKEGEEEYRKSHPAEPPRKLKVPEEAHTNGTGFDSAAPQKEDSGIEVPSGLGSMSRNAKWVSFLNADPVYSNCEKQINYLRAQHAITERKISETKEAIWKSPDDKTQIPLSEDNKFFSKRSDEELTKIGELKAQKAERVEKLKRTFDAN